MKNLVELSLGGNMFSGQLPECLRNLTKLRTLDLSDNSFSGNFPSFTSNLTSLEYLSLFRNYLQGSFSLSTLANHSKLQVLYISPQSPGAQVETEKTKWYPTFQLTSLILRGCNLNRDIGNTIPSFLLYQKDLQYIDLSHNKLVGVLPNWLIQNNSGLETLYLMNNSFVGNLQLSSIRQDICEIDISHNNLSGLLPKDIGTFLPRIDTLYLAMNNLEGHIPTSIGKMQNLISLDLSHNLFSGELPEQLATGCISLYGVGLANNFLQGNIPNFSNSTHLSGLYLNNNNLNVTLREVLANLNSEVLLILDISNNSISGEIPSSIGKFSKMTDLNISENQLEGEIPFGISNLTLKMLDLSQNRLSGSVSSFNLSSMQFLYLQKNAFSGSIPFTFSQGFELVTLDLRDNNLSGSIPNWMDKLYSLRMLLLGGNNFHGHIPIQLCQLKNISIMDLSRNKINGSIPSCFNNLSFGRIYDSDSDTVLPTTGRLAFSEVASSFNASVIVYRASSDLPLYEFGQVAVEFRTKSHYYSYTGKILEYMSGMDLSCNMLTGIIPSEIGDLQQVKALNLSHNHLSGSIPITFSNLTQIESLDLSFNNLTGEIPSQLTLLHFLSVFNVSYNNLSGRPPSEGQFADFDDENYRGNPGLCGPPPQAQV
ncbi:Leucine-rich repeat [Sesbania bispinosa]|nr:Leucine-rich repeat [Sesbania bispinosa]